MESTEHTLTHLNEALGQREGLIAAIVALSRRNIDLETRCSKFDEHQITWERSCVAYKRDIDDLGKKVASQEQTIAEQATLIKKLGRAAKKKVGKKNG